MLNGILASGWDFPPQPHSDPSSVVGLTRFWVCLHTRCSFAFLPCPVPPQTPLQIAPPNLHLAEVLSFPTSPSLPLAPCLSRSPDSSTCGCLVVSSFCSHTVPTPRMLQGCDRGEQAGAESVMQFCKCPCVIEAQKASVRLRCGTKPLVWGDRDLVWG